MLEIVDLRIGAQPVGFGTEALDALDQDAAVPGAVEDRHPAVARNVPPETPQIGLRALFLGRRGHRDDLVIARVHRRGDAADGAALAGRIGTFEGADQRTALEARVAHQFRQLALPARQLLVVVLLAQPLLQVEFREQVAAVDVHPHRRRHRRGQLAGVGQALADRLEQDLARHQRTVAVILALDDDPRRPRRVGHAQDVAGDILQFVVGLQTLPVPAGDAPGRLRVLFQQLQPPLLADLGEVEPELQHQRTLIDQHGFEAVDLIDACVHRRLGHVALEAIMNRARVPRAGKDADAALGRQGTPVAPHERPRTLLVAWRRECQGGDETRIHPLVEDVDGFALAGAVLAADQHDDRNLAVFLEVELGVEQSGAQGRHFLLVGFLVELVTDFRGFEHYQSPQSAIIAARAPSPAVSVRNTRGPSPTG